MVERERTAIQLAATHFRVLGGASLHVRDRVATPSHAMAEALYTTEDVLDTKQTVLNTHVYHMHHQ